MINISSIIALDFHTHARTAASGDASNLDSLAEYYRERNLACVVFPVDAESATGVKPVPNEVVAEAAARHPDVLIPFASIDPWKGRAGARQVSRLVEQHGVRGFKFQPTTQAFYPNDNRVYPLYAAIAEYGVPAIFHSGQTMMGKSLPGGGGIRLKYANPMFLDDVAADFPDMPIVIAHPSFPWQDEALAVANHKPQVYIDLSGWSPKYFPPQLVTYANTLLKDKVLFGSDYPMLTPDRWLADFARAEFRDAVRPLILKQNAARLLSLST